MPETQEATNRPEIPEKVADQHAEQLSQLQRELGGLGVYSRLVEYHRLILQMGEFSPGTRAEPELLVFWPEESVGAIALRVEVSDVSDPAVFTWHGGLYRADNPPGAAEVIRRAVESLRRRAGDAEGSS